MEKKANEEAAREVELAKLRALREEFEHKQALDRALREEVKRRQKEIRILQRRNSNGKL
jgi:hypothetical protein